MGDASMPTVRRRLRIQGDVQGVGFRFAAVRKAMECSVRGVIRNEPDGMVYCEAEGDLQSVQAFIEWCRTGPSFSDVQRVEIVELPPAGYADFTIQYS